MEFMDLFSYWIFAWYVLYMVGLPYNPKFALTVALLENVVKVCTMVYYKNKWNHIVLFCAVVLCIKGIPLWTLRRTSYTREQVLATLVLLMVYESYLAINGKSVVSILKKSYQDVQHDRFVGPMSVLLKKMGSTPQGTPALPY